MNFSNEFQKNDKKVGYAYLKDKLQLGVFDPKITAEVSSSVNSLIRKDALLLVPIRYQLSPEDLVGHVLFALIHEGINLQILSEALRHISENVIVNAIADKLSGIYGLFFGLPDMILIFSSKAVTPSTGTGTPRLVQNSV